METPVTTDAGRFNRKFFFSFVREYLFTGKLRQPQVDGLSALLDVWEAEHAAEDDRWFAYMLGTAHHETAQTLRPIVERGGTLYLRKRMTSWVTTRSVRAAMAIPRRATACAMRGVVSCS